MSTQPVHPDASEIDAAHQRAVMQWRDWFNRNASTRPTAGLLGLLAQQLATTGRKDWAALLLRMKLVNEEDAKEIQSQLENPPRTFADKGAMQMRPHNKTWTLFVQAVQALRNHDEADLEALYALTADIDALRGKLPRLVKHIWDGYFLYSREVAKQHLNKDRAQWYMDIPAIRLGQKDSPQVWHVLTRVELENANAPVWDEFKEQENACLQTRFVAHEYQMPALWQAVDRNDRKAKAFSAVKSNVDAMVSIRDMGLALSKSLTFPNKDKDKDKDDQFKNTEGEARFFSLPGLLWAMGLDGGLRRSSEMQTIKDRFTNAQLSIQLEKGFKMSTQQTGAFHSGEKALSAAQLALSSFKSGESSRLAVSGDAYSTVHLMTSSILPMHTESATSMWQAEEDTHVLHISDSPHLRLTDWKEKTFYALAGGRTMPVVFGIEGNDGKVQEWVWGNSQDWGLDDDGVTAFEIWPLIEEDHAFHRKKCMPLVTDAMMIDMAKFGDFRDGYCVLYLQIYWL